MSQGTARPEADRYQGFSLLSVTWGYRDIFEKTIEELFREGRLGPDRREVTSKFFDLLKRSDQSCFDYVLHQFLGALSPRNRWIMDLPALFADVVDLGASLARSRLHHGIRFFEVLAGGGMGGSPAEVRRCLDGVRRLRETDEDLAVAFLGSYARLCARLDPREMERYLDVALAIHRTNAASACSFLRGELKSSETYILAITQECRLQDVAAPLGAMMKALTGTECQIADLGRLDADDLLERGTRTLTVGGHLYLPVRFRRFDSVQANRNWYVLCAIVSAGLLSDKSFPCIHGHAEYRSCLDLTGADPRRVNLFHAIEIVRVLSRVCRRWPGARRLVHWGLGAELDDAEPDGPERLIADAMNDALDTPALRTFRRVARAAVNCFESAERLDETWSAEVLEAYPCLAARLIRPLGFVSDFLFPVSFAKPPSDRLISDLKAAAKVRVQAGKHGESEARGVAEAATASEGEAEPGGAAAAFVYDEWDFEQNEYRPAWCHVRQKPVEPVGIVPPRAEWLEEARRVRTVFERLRPDLARREKHLADGDDINPDLLLAHIIERTREPGPPARFYEKPVINRRDLAVLLLLDVSGSTGEQAGAQARVLDVEKQAVVILGQGLAALGDRFAVCGFSSNGREQCEYLVFKSFEDPWDAQTITRVMAAWPRSSTRIGFALRHSGYLLSLQPHRQRLIFLVTDGKPMDQGYDPHTRYAQHDVRMACEENERKDVHTFAISTADNSLADMEIMFPRRRFAILADIAHLPLVLPQMYLRLTL